MLFPPFRMKAEQAAYYLSISVTTFRREVQKGTFPNGKKQPGGRFWLRDELEKAVLGEGPKKTTFDQPI